MDAALSILQLCVVSFISSNKPVEAVDCRKAVCDFDVPADCQNWRNVDCNLRNNNRTWIHLTSRSFPMQAREIYISNVQQVYLHSNALKHLRFLTKIDFSHVEMLIMYNKSMSRNSQVESKGSSRIAISVSRVQKLQLRSGVFSDCYMKDSKLIIRSVQECRIMTSAFPSNTSLGTVSLEDILSMTAASKAFSSDVKDLFLKKINMDICKKNTFVGQVQNFSLKEIKVKKIMRGCVTASHDWETLLIQSCNLQHIESLGFQGRIKKTVLIQDNNIKILEAEGFSLNATYLGMEQNTIGELAGKVFGVQKDFSFTVNTHGINFQQQCSCFIKEHARLIFGLKVQPASIAVKSNQENEQTLFEIHCKGKANNQTPIEVYYQKNCRDLSGSSPSKRPEFMADENKTSNFVAVAFKIMSSVSISTTTITTTTTSTTTSTTFSTTVTIATTTTEKAKHFFQSPGEQVDLNIGHTSISAAADTNIALYIAFGVLAVIVAVALIVCHRRLKYLEAQRSESSPHRGYPMKSLPPPPSFTADVADPAPEDQFLDHTYEEVV